jgi:hypothetical protein
MVETEAVSDFFTQLIAQEDINASSHLGSF